METWHGTAGGYTNHACRCEACREANRIHHLEYMHARPEQQQRHREWQHEWDKRHPGYHQEWRRKKMA